MVSKRRSAASAAFAMSGKAVSNAAWADVTLVKWEAGTVAAMCKGDWRA